MGQPRIKDLAIIGNKKTCAIIDKEGAVVWYCPWRFDQPSLFSFLIDEAGGSWTIEAAGKQFCRREYKGESAVLVSYFKAAKGSFSVTDFMPLGSNLNGIVRFISPAPVSVTSKIHLTPNYGRSSFSLKKGKEENTLYCPSFEFYLKASHPLRQERDCVEMVVPAGESGWMVLVEEKKALRLVSEPYLEKELQNTEERWKALMAQISYEGLYKAQMYQAYKFINMVTHEHSGGILAAGTTSLPEHIGADRNYDYRYVWLRDTAMNVSALIRAGSKGKEAERFLDFLCMGRDTNKKNLFVPFYDLDAKTAPDETYLPVTGYRDSLPVRIGNGAFEQLQLDGQGNVLLAAKQIYSQSEEKPHWRAIVKTADYLVKNWRKKDHGIWEEHVKAHYTSSKVLVVKGLEFIAKHAESEKQKERWLAAAQEIRTFIQEHCMTTDGAYAVSAGSEEVDVTAALYPVWWFDTPDSPAMLQTISRIEKEYKEGELYHRRLEESDSKQEGVFLAASLWMAQYYISLNSLKKAKVIIDAVLEFSTDLGLLPEEGDIRTGELLGNIPQTFVHSSLMGVILDYKEAMEKS